MELNREQIEKALDWLDSLVGNSNDSDMALFTYQLLGILYYTCEELTEKNERLRKALISDLSRGSGKTVHLREVARIKMDAVKADTVRKMQERCKERTHRFTDGTNDYDYVPVEELDQIAKEILEGSE